MPKISPHQFQNYSFDAGTDDEGMTHVVAYKSNRDKTDMYPVGSLSIDGSQRQHNLEEQEQIYRGEKFHYVTGEQTGQLRWAGGTMNDSIDKVSWLGLDNRTVGRRDAPHVLRAMLGIGVETHGSVPHADRSLSEYGSRISRAMHRRYGIKPHPDNNEMSPTFSFGSNPDRMSETVVIQADSAAAEIGDGSFMKKFKTYDDPSEIAGVAQRLADVSASRRKKPAKKPDYVQDPLPGMDSSIT